MTVVKRKRKKRKVKYPVGVVKRDKGKRSEGEIIRALEIEGGLVSRASKKLGYANPVCLFKYIREHENVKEALAGIRMANLDNAESALMTKIKGRPGRVVYQKDAKGNYVFDKVGKPIVIENIKEITPDLGAICFYLKCLGKERGYVEKVQITGGGEPIKTENYVHKRIENVNLNIDARLNELQEKEDLIKAKLIDLKKLGKSEKIIEGGGKE